MDVLSHWQPNLETKKFQKGQFREPFWGNFLDFIALCHAVQHWTVKGDEAKRMARQVKKGGWEQSVRKAEDHQFRARWLAAEKVWLMEKFSQSNEEEALVEQIVLLSRVKKDLQSHEWANFGQLAIEHFDGKL